MTNTDTDIYARVGEGNKLLSMSEAERPFDTDLAVDVNEFGRPPGIPRPTTDVFTDIASQWICGWTDSEFALIPLTETRFRNQTSGAISLDVPQTAVTTQAGLSHIEVDSVSIVTAEQIPIEHVRRIDSDDNDAYYQLTAATTELIDRLQLSSIETGDGELFTQRYVRVRDTSSRELQPTDDGELYMQCQDLEFPPEFPDTMYDGIPINLSDETTAAVWETADESFDNYVMTATEITVVTEDELPAELDL